ncbi:MAG: GAF domain-containing protein [Acidobacteria bacterium]|nr:GAF domain-containing protein [Acidobacteriota bacterium]
MRTNENGFREVAAMLARTESIAHIGSWEWDIAEDRVHWSQELFRLFGLDPAAGTPPYSEHGKLFLPEDMDRLGSAVDLCRNDGTPFVLELGIRRSDGTVGRCISCGEAVRDDAGHIHRLVGSLQDVTEILEAKEESKRSVMRLRAIVDILQYHPDSLQDLLNRSLDKVVELTGSRFGYIYTYDDERREFTINSWSRDVMAECAIPKPPSVYRLEETGIWGEAVRQRKPLIVNDFEAPNPLRKGVPEGHVKIRRFLTIPVLFRDRIVAVVGVANKPSEYTETDRLELTLLMDSVWKEVEAFRGEEALRRMEWLLTRGSVPDAGPFIPPYGDIAALNTDGLILSSVGKRMLTDIVSDSISLLGTSAAVYESNGDYALLHLCSDWCRLLDAASRRLCHTDDNRAALADSRWLCHQTCWNHAARAAMESGRPLDIRCPGSVRLYAVPILSGGKGVGAIHFAYGDPPREPALLRRLADRFEVDEDELAQAAESYEPRPPFIVEVAKRQLEASARLIGEIVQRRQTELEREKFRAQLLQVQKMESVGRLAGGVAHDFNNALNVILGYSEQALEGLPETDPLRADLEEIHRAARHSAAVSRQLLGFARKQPIHPQRLDLNGAVERMLRMLDHLLGEDILLDWDPAPDLWLVAMDPSQVEQILANLCINARDAIEGTGSISIKTSNVHLAESEDTAPEESAPGDYVLLTVADTGCGMDRNILDNLFEPFFTTKGPGKGTGLGLATVYGIVRQNRGFIRVDSRPGRGSRFRIYLPREEAQTVAPTAREVAMESGQVRADEPASMAATPLETPAPAARATAGSPGASARAEASAASLSRAAAAGGTVSAEASPAAVSRAAVPDGTIPGGLLPRAAEVSEPNRPASPAASTAPAEPGVKEREPKSGRVRDGEKDSGKGAPAETPAPAAPVTPWPESVACMANSSLAPPAGAASREGARVEAPSGGEMFPAVSGPARSAAVPMPPMKALADASILLPAAFPGAAPLAAALPAELGGAGTGEAEDMVLLVEDEPAVLRLAKRMIERLGYSVIDAGSPAEALERVRRHAPRLKLLVTDVIMPGMNGRALAERLRVLRPELKVLFMSGYTADVIARSGMLEPDTHFIQKPFSRQDLSAKIREALES